MGKLNLDQEILRAGTNASKWEILMDPEDPHKRYITIDCYGENRVLPMWVADMDFACPPPVIAALVTRAQHGIFGYTYRDDSYDRAVAGWMSRRHGWAIDTDWITITPGVVPAIKNLIQAFSQAGDKILLQPPVYYPFYSAIEENGRQVARNPLLYENGRYYMDFVELERTVADPQVTMAILCSPHNPVSRVWTEAELQTFGDICLDHHVLVIADEIHADLTFFGTQFIPFAKISERFLMNSVTCTAASKTFNLAGLHTSNIIIADEDKREQFIGVLEKNGLGGMNPFGLEAIKAAYNGGEPWLTQVLDYIEENYLFLKEYLAGNIPELSVLPLEGTYLVWLDCRRLGLSVKELRKLFLDEARVCLDDGYIFGSEGDGFQRVNIACPRSILEEALIRIEHSVKALSIAT
ncbi:MAG: MalY/PatB family protein [Candidatus Promineifilaceae bacterium]|nr:MalY/PatB family protein [Candidatus Promineifilaceae bacterium]